MRKANLILTTFFSIVCCSINAQTELLQNTNFETPGAYWTASGNFQYNNLYCCNYNSPTSFAYLSDASGNAMNNAVGDLAQASIYVPANATALTLSFYTYIGTLETTTTQPFDVLHVTVSDGSYSDYVDLSNLDHTSGYVLHTYSIAGYLHYLGQYVTLNFHGTTDGGLPTKFRIDDASLKATTPNCSAVSVNSQPSDQTVSSGNTAQFCVTATGTPTFTYQWYNQNGQIIGANSSCYTTPILSISDNGNQYYCIISNCNNAYQDQSNNAFLTVNSSCSNVSISNTLLNQNATVGGNVTWTVNTSGTAPFNYQWYRNGVQISGANSNTYTTPNLTLGYNGNTYYCSVTNCSGSGIATSNTATLTVTTSCVSASISNTLLNQSSTVGGNVTWTVNAGGTAPFYYQWFKNGLQISGAVSNVYTTPALTMSNNGNTYYCVVTNCSGAGNVSSNIATLTVNGSITPTITVTSPNGGEIWNIGSPQNIIANITGTITSKIIEISYDGGNTWGICIGFAPNSSNSLNYLWTASNQTSNTCKIKVTVYYNGGEVSDVSDGNFSIINTGLVHFDLNSNLSHLRWPFASPSSWSARNQFYGAQADSFRNINDNSNYSGGYGNNMGGHHQGDFFADDWNKVSSPDECDLNFYSPLSGVIIFSNQDCIGTCNRKSCYKNNSCASLGHNPSDYGNQVVIRSKVKSEYCFRIAHLNTVFSQIGDTVDVGSLIGTIGSTGASDGSHAHCALYKDVSRPANFHCQNTSGVQELSHGFFLTPVSSATPGKNDFACNFVFDATIGGDLASGGSDDYIVIQPPASTILCQGDSILLTCNSASNYLWSTGDTTKSIFVNTPGDYHVSIIDSLGNFYTDNIFISQLDSFSVSISPSGPISICNGDYINLSASDGTSYLWSTSETTSDIIVNTPGVYSVTVSNSFACNISSSTSITVTTIAPPLQPIIQVNATFYLASNSSPHCAYQWSLNGIAVEGANSQFYIADSIGYYTVTITDTITGCSSTSIPTFVLVGIENILKSDAIRIYPNPVENFVTIEFNISQPHDKISLKLYNPIGQIVESSTENNYPKGLFSKTFNTKDLKNGIYNLEIQVSGIYKINKRIVILK